jgi:uncharacterized protein YjiS (DUF1127 family)
MTSRFERLHVPIAALMAHLAWRRWISLHTAVVSRFRRWREERQTWDALRHLDDRQLKDFGIHSRSPDLMDRKFF